MSRFYRAPEIILGCKVDGKIDVWAAGCTVWEMLKNDILFPGKKDNNGQLLSIMQKKGRCPKALINSGDPNITKEHFDS